MFRSSWKLLLVGAVVATTLGMGASEADACSWWGCYRPAAWGCCYTPWHSVSYDPCCYSYGGCYVGLRPGPIRRLLFGPYRWYCGSWACCYPSYYCYDTCCYNVCCEGVFVGDVTTAPAEKAVPTPAKKPVVDTAPAEPAAAPPAEPPATIPGLEPEPATTPETSVVPTRANSGLLTIYVPYDAKVTINGLVTRSIGSRRQYISYGLKPGFSYKYEIRAELVRDGQRLEDVRAVILTAGAREAVAFGFNATATEELASSW